MEFHTTHCKSALRAKHAPTCSQRYDVARGQARLLAMCYTGCRRGHCIVIQHCAVGPRRHRPCKALCECPTLIPCRMDRLSSELRSQSALGSISTGLRDHLGTRSGVGLLVPDQSASDKYDKCAGFVRRCSTITISGISQHTDLTMLHYNHSIHFCSSHLQFKFRRAAVLCLCSEDEQRTN